MGSFIPQTPSGWREKGSFIPQTPSGWREMRSFILQTPSGWREMGSHLSKNDDESRHHGSRAGGTVSCQKPCAAPGAMDGSWVVVLLVLRVGRAKGVQVVRSVEWEIW